MDATIQQPSKPIDRWLGLVGIAVGVAFYLLPKTPAVVLLSLIFIFALLIHPIWNLWWVERKLWRKSTATLVLILAFIGVNYSRSNLVAGRRHVA